MFYAFYICMFTCKHIWEVTNPSVCACVLLVSRELPVEEEIIQTQLHSRTSDEYYTYSNVPWKLYMRKEVCFMSTVKHKWTKLIHISQKDTVRICVFFIDLLVVNITQHYSALISSYCITMT